MLLGTLTLFKSLLMAWVAFLAFMLEKSFATITELPSSGLAPKITEAVDINCEFS